jgi:hypothetical protein
MTSLNFINFSRVIYSREKRNSELKFRLIENPKFSINTNKLGGKK